jgi:transposase
MGCGCTANALTEPDLQFTFEADVEQAELLAGHLKRIDKQVATTAPECRYGPVIHALMCLRDIRVTTGFGLAVEIGDWTRFTGSSIGLVPSEDSSGQSRHQGPITKAGNTYARKLIIDAASQRRRPYTRPGERLLRQLELVAPATRIRALEGNHRLHHKWEAFDARHKMSVKATTAIARELAGWCWSLAAPLQQGELMTAA